MRRRLRDSYSTLLRALETDLKLQQSLLRHANIATARKVYTEAMPEQKREAAEKVAAQLPSVVRVVTQAIQ
jgi:integrase